ncbi:hypothetical protein AAEU32_06450 [Pseudoalteromonas sp. SSDWG2]|uniref:hypothetical protein n=1 Tax=Pseudoalteromonas sp. SSDWG2 TaxID=3139391 RepID=UPI003BAB726A
MLLLTLGAALYKVLTSSQTQAVIDYYGARAYLAAQSGIERAMQEITFQATPNCSTLNGVSYTFDSTQLQACTVNLSCISENNVPEPTVASGSISIFRIEATASCSVENITTVRSLIVGLRLED